MWAINWVYSSYTFTDACDASPTAVLSSVTSSDPDDGLADGHTSGVIAGATLGTPDMAFQLRAERNATKKKGRTYTVSYTATDASDNDMEGEAQVIVPHDRH
jgi:hypothetical protein